MPVFDGGSLWDLFSRQHGPHRQGAGMLVMAALGGISGWDTRWDSYAVAAVFVLSGLLAIWLLARCGVPAWLGAVVSAVLFLNPRQFEALVGTPNLSHGALPVFFLLCACHMRFVRAPWPRAVVSVFLGWMLVFTGPGFSAEHCFCSSTSWMVGGRQDGRRRLLPWRESWRHGWCSLSTTRFRRRFRTSAFHTNFRTNI